MARPRQFGMFIGAAALALSSMVTPEAAAERLPIKTYTTADGLARDSISRIVRDSKGFLWFCTSEGLSRFDGYRFTNYGLDQGLPGRSVHALIETRGGQYWVATNNGLCRFNPEAATTPDALGQARFTFDYEGQETRGRVIYTVLEDHTGVIWCGGHKGLFRLDQRQDRWVCTRVDLGDPSTRDGKFFQVAGLLEDRQGSLWIACSTGLYRRRSDGSMQRFAEKEGIQGGLLGSAMLEDPGGRIWITAARGLCRLAAEPAPNAAVIAQVYTTADGLASNYITSLFQAADGRFWVGTDRGLSELLPAADQRGRGFQSYTRDNGLSDYEVTAISEDRHGNLWLGTESSGAMKIAINGFTTYHEADGLRGTRINALLLDQANGLCAFGGSNKEMFISRFNGQRFEATQLRLPSGYTWSWGWYQAMFQARSGEWWMQMGSGVIRYPRLPRLAQLARARPQAIYAQDERLVFRIYEDSRGDVWIGALSNDEDLLTRWERRTETFHRFTAEEGLPSQFAPTAFGEDAAGNLWIGFYNGGLARYVSGRFTMFTTADGLPAGFIRGIYLDHAHRLWIATAEGGVARIDDPQAEHPSFVVYNTAKGLSSNQATAVTEDQWGRIYIGTGGGVDRLDTETGQIKHYTTADGLASNYITVALRDREGALWFGTLQGLSRFVPEPDRPTPPPPTFISALRLAGVSYPISDLGAAAVAGLELGSARNQIQIDFVGLSLGVGEALRYQYKLEGADTDWSAPADQRTVNYPNLAPGSYNFLVRAVTADGLLSELPATVSFKILPPVWQRWWFNLLALALIATPIVIVARYRYQRMKAEREAEVALRKSREERLRELEQVRRRIATDLHDDIGSSLTQISILSEVAKQRIGADDSQVSAPLSMIASASRELIDSMSDIVWAINPQKDHLNDLTQRMRRFASDVLTARNIAFEFSEPAEEDDVQLGANIRREVFLIFKESINNLVRHSGCTEAEIIFRIAAGTLELKVRDNGKGFDMSQPGEGHGLSSMRRRAEGIAGRLEMISIKGEGTTITLEMSLAGSA